MFSEKGLVNLKFFTIFTLLTLLFAISLLGTLKELFIIGEIEELQELIREIEDKGGELEKTSLIHLSFTQESNISQPLVSKDIDGHSFITIYQNGIVLQKDISIVEKIFWKATILILLFLLGIVFLTFLYAKIASRDIRQPISILNRYLDRVNGNSLHHIPKEKLPEDFHLLVDTINNLINRIDTFIGSQKELFIGVSHELKTPLAVIKLKNQVLLIKEREKEEYIEQIHFINQKIDEMDRIVSDVLNIGRLESAQFEQPVELDIISFLKEKGEEFSLIAKSQDRNIVINLQPDSFIATIQKTLLNQIVQNFLQNAIKFTPKGKKIELRSYLNPKGNLVIEVIDEGIGIDEKEDIFAPFHRKGNKSGVGLGLFLAKSGADAMGAKISVKNRSDGVGGAIATLELQNRLVCPI